MFSQISEPQRPSIVGWYAFYCIAMACMYLLLVVSGFIILIGGTAGEMDPTEATIMSVMFIGLGLVFAIPYAAGPLLPRERWAWIVGIVLICIGLSSVCCLPAAIPLLLGWLKPETKRYYNAGGD